MLSTWAEQHSRDRGERGDGHATTKGKATWGQYLGAQVFCFLQKSTFEGQPVLTLAQFTVLNQNDYCLLSKQDSSNDTGGNRRELEMCWEMGLCGYPTRVNREGCPETC